jgi:hypothetical protein
LPVFVLNLDSLKIASETESFHETSRGSSEKKVATTPHKNPKSSHRSSEKKVATKKVPRYIEVGKF